VRSLVDGMEIPDPWHPGVSLKVISAQGIGGLVQFDILKIAGVK
jgi:hypothetical protein